MFIKHLQYSFDHTGHLANIVTKEISVCSAVMINLRLAGANIRRLIHVPFVWFLTCVMHVSGRYGPTITSRGGPPPPLEQKPDLNTCNVSKQNKRP